MIPRKFVRTATKWALGLLFALTITALAQTLTAQRASRLSVSGGGPATPFGTSTCPATVLANDGGTSGNARAPSTRFASSRSVYLIKATELAANGYVSGNSPLSVGWDYQIQAGPAGSAPLKIYLQNTADTTYLKGTSFSAAIAGMTTVHNATTLLPGAVGPFDVTLAGGSPFTYTGGGLYVAYEWGPYVGTLSTTAVVWCNSTGLINGLAGANTSSDTLAVSSFRPSTRLSSSTQNDAAVGLIYSYGELPLGLVPAQVVKSAINNKGALMQTSLPVTLNITGADSFTDMQTVASLAACSGQGIVTFAGFFPSALGTDTVAVSVPADEVASNNILTKSVSITGMSYSYKYPGSTATGGVGFTGAAGALLGKFTTTAANAVTAVKLEFPAATATTYRVAIYADSGSGTPSTGAPLYLDAVDRTVGPVGPVTITLPSPVAVGPGNFFVGIHQTNTTNAGLGFDVESPIRSGQFFEASPLPPTAWFDFSPGGDFKINIGINLQTAAPTATQVVSRKIQGGTPFDIVLPAVECRSTGGTNDYQLIFTFASSVTFSGAAVTGGTGSVSGSSGGGTTTVTVNLTGVFVAGSPPPGQQVTVMLTSVNDGVSTGDVFAQMDVLVGDSGGNGTVNASDVTQTKSRIGQVLSAANFRSDVNASGGINGGDVSVVKSRLGTALPP